MVLGMLARRLAVLGTAIALALPSVAAAQSAGDDQYTDPFGGGDQSGQQEQSGDSQDGSAPQDPAPAAPAPEPAPAPAGAAPAAAEPAPAPPAATATTAAAPQLPRTGMHTWLVLALGGTLLAGGVALRSRAR